jgi:hypothetical protein
MVTDEQQDQIKDILRLIAPEQDRRAFINMLEIRVRGHELHAHAAFPPPRIMVGGLDTCGAKNCRCAFLMAR